MHRLSELSALSPRAHMHAHGNAGRAALCPMADASLSQLSACTSKLVHLLLCLSVLAASHVTAVCVFGLLSARLPRCIANCTQRARVGVMPCVCASTRLCWLAQLDLPA